MTSGAYKKIGDQGAGEFRAGISSYNPSNAFNTAAFEACEFHRFGNRTVKVLDAMSGPGKFGLSIIENFSKHKDALGLECNIDMHFNDVLTAPLITLAKSGVGRGRLVGGDIRNLSSTGLKFELIAIRYGIKDLPKEEQPKALKSIFDSLENEGRIVIADMIAHTPAGQEGVNRIHLEKQIRAGRDVKKEGVCHIPLLEEWDAIVQYAGFNNTAPLKLVGGIKENGAWVQFTSDVETFSGWKGQFGSGANDRLLIHELNVIIAETARENQHFAREFNVSVCGLGTPEERVTLSFPIAIIASQKPMNPDWMNK